MLVDITKVTNLVKERHAEQLYGEHPYFVHLSNVRGAALNLAVELNIREPELLSEIEAVALLHDILEDTNTTREEIKSQFGETVLINVMLLSIKEVVAGVTKTNDEYFGAISESHIAKLVKAADRISNISEIPELNTPEKKKKLYTKYTNELPYFIKYNIFPDKIKEALNTESKGLE